MHLPLILFLTELWHLLDVSAVAGHGVVLACFYCVLITLTNCTKQYSKSGKTSVFHVENIF